MTTIFHRGFLRLPEDRIVAEQLRLMLGNTNSVVMSAILLACIIVLALHEENGGSSLYVWLAAIVLSNMFALVETRRVFSRPLTPERVRAAIGVQMGTRAIGGALWGSLAWITMSEASPTINVTVLALLAGIAGSTVSSLASLFPVFLAFIVANMATIGIKLWLMETPAYRVLALILPIYLATLILLARNSAKETLAAIRLRFENLDLLGRLQTQTVQLEAAHRQAEEANLAKSKFLAAASHDLRQPIHAQGLFLEALARSELSPRQRAMLDNARATSAASSEMLNTLLDFSRVEAGVMEPQVRPFHLQPLLNKIENEMAPLAVDKGLVFRVRETPAAVESDPALVELILRNLVSNAIRYTEQGGILVACRRRNEYIVVEVWDTGVGIPVAQIQEVFREFHQLGNPERDRRKGLGLGLAIADRLAKTLGLDLAVASVPGRGSVFRLSLPLTHAAVTSDESDAKPYETRMLNARVLVIDDDEAVRVGMLHLLQEWGCECEAVDSIEEALAAARARLPNIVVSDYRLREQHTGMEAIERLRAEFGPDLPALLITGDTIPERLREARACNVPLLHKPVSSLLLNKTLVRVLAGRGRETGAPEAVPGDPHG